MASMPLPSPEGNASFKKPLKPMRSALTDAAPSSSGTPRALSDDGSDDGSDASRSTIAQVLRRTVRSLAASNVSFASLSHHEAELREYSRQIQYDALHAHGVGGGVGIGYRRHIGRVVPLAAVDALVDVWVWIASFTCARLKGRAARFFSFVLPLLARDPFLDHVMFRLNIAWRVCAAAIISFLWCAYAPSQYTGAMCFVTPLCAVGVPAATLGTSVTRCRNMSYAVMWAGVSSFVACSILLLYDGEIYRRVMAAVLLVITTFLFLVHQSNPNHEAVFMIVNGVSIIRNALSPSQYSILLPFMGVAAAFIACIIGMAVTLFPVPVIAYGAVIRNVGPNLQLSCCCLKLFLDAWKHCHSNPRLARVILKRCELRIHELREAVAQYEEDITLAASELWFCRLRGFDQYMHFQLTLVYILELLVAELRSVDWENDLMKLTSEYLGPPGDALVETLMRVVDPLEKTLVRGFHMTPWPYYARDRSDDPLMDNFVVEHFFHAGKYSDTDEQAQSMHSGSVDRSGASVDLMVQNVAPDVDLDMLDLDDKDYWKYLVHNRSGHRSHLDMAANMLEFKEHLRVSQDVIFFPEPSASGSKSSEEPLVHANISPMQSPATAPSYPVHQGYQHIVLSQRESERQQKRSLSHPDARVNCTAEKLRDHRSPLVVSLQKFEDAYFELRRHRFREAPEVPWIHSYQLPLLSVVFLLLYFVRVMALLTSSMDHSSTGQGRLVRRAIARVRSWLVNLSPRLSFLDITPAEDIEMKRGVLGGGSSRRLHLTASFSFAETFHIFFPHVRIALEWLIQPILLDFPKYLLESFTSLQGLRNFLLFSALREKYSRENVLGSVQISFAVLLASLTVFVPQLQAIFLDGGWAYTVVATAMVRNGGLSTFSRLTPIMIGTMFGTMAAYFSVVLLSDSSMLMLAFAAISFLCGFIVADHQSSLTPIFSALLTTFVLVMFRVVNTTAVAGAVAKELALSRLEAVTVGLLIVAGVSMLRPQLARLVLRRAVSDTMDDLWEFLCGIVDHVAHATDISHHRSDMQKADRYVLEKIVAQESGMEARVDRIKILINEVLAEPRVLQSRFPHSVYLSLVDEFVVATRALGLLGRAVLVGVLRRPHLLALLSKLFLQFKGHVGEILWQSKAQFQSPYAVLLWTVPRPAEHKESSEDSAVRMPMCKVLARMRRVLVQIFVRFHTTESHWMRTSVTTDISALHAVLEGASKFADSISRISELASSFVVHFIDG